MPFPIVTACVLSDTQIFYSFTVSSNEILEKLKVDRQFKLMYDLALFPVVSTRILFNSNILSPLPIPPNKT